VNWFSILMIYILFWTISSFLVFPFHVKTSDELGQPKVPGQADSAPHVHRPLSIAIWTTVVATTLFLLFYLNYRHGWIGAETLDLFHDPIK
jgi:predicted secreted protein